MLQIGSVLRPALDTYFPESMSVRIIAEPGRFFVASAFTLAVCIIAKRRVCRDESDQSGKCIRSTQFWQVCLFKVSSICGLQEFITVQSSIQYNLMDLAKYFCCHGEFRCLPLSVISINIWYSLFKVGTDIPWYSNVSYPKRWDELPDKQHNSQLGIPPKWLVISN